MLQDGDVLDALLMWCMSNLLNGIVKGSWLYIQAVMLVISQASCSSVLIGSQTCYAWICSLSKLSGGGRAVCVTIYVHKQPAHLLQSRRMIHSGFQYCNDKIIRLSLNMKIAPQCFAFFFLRICDFFQL